MPTNDPPPKNWWPLSKASTGKYLRQDSNDEQPLNRLQSNAVKTPGFKSFAEALLLKPKKQSHPFSLSFHSPTILDPLNCSSTSPTLSPADSLGPRTPFDFCGKPRQSVLTLADDPFAGDAPVIPISVSRSLTDTSCLSAHSTSSGTDLASRKIDSPLNRTSYASSSTTNSHGIDNNFPVSVVPVLPEAKKHRLRLNFSSKMPDQRQSSFVPLATFDPSVGSGLKDTTVAQRPKLRSRGMTDGGSSHKAGFFVQDQKRPRNLSQISMGSNILPMTTDSIPTPRVIVRLPSSSRLQAPLTSPPTKTLPATPPSPIDHDQLDPRQRKGLEPLLVSSSLPVPSAHDSILSSFYNNKRRSQRDLRNPEESITEIAEPSSSSRILKKASSQRSLGRRSSPSLSTVAAEPPSDKRKQWNFPNTRLPVPILPLSIRTSCSPSPSSRASSGDMASPVSVTESKKSRKRLFSTSILNQSRPSTSACVPATPKEDDTLSMASTRSDHNSSYIPWKVTRNYPEPPSCSEEGQDTTPMTPSVPYHPQAIMSRDELAALDATVSRMAESHRQASQSSDSSVISSLSMASCSFPALFPKEAVEEPDPVGLSPPPSRRRSVRTSCSTILSVKSHLDSPATADPFIRTDVEAGVFDKSPLCFPDGQQDSTSFMTSLSPPPRPRLRSTNSGRTISTLATTNCTERQNILNSKVSERPHPTKGPSTTLNNTSLRAPSSSVRKQAGTSRTKTWGTGGGVTLEKAIHRSSIMRKPSFLEIDVESESETIEKRDSLFLSMKASTAAGSASTALNGSKAETDESFLDLARESFDTVRS